ncbi:MAG: 30S ribosomal protein S7 [Candidatus Aminicenantaceae bacterium]
MSRKGKINKDKRKKKPDTYYNSTLISRFINTCLKDGKKSLAKRIVYGAMDDVKEKSKKDPLKMFEKAVEIVTPRLETKSRRVGGATYQVPIEVPEERATSLAVRWIVNFASNRAGKSMTSKLSAEIMDAVNNKGGAVKKREDKHKMAEANRAFAHYKW